MHQALCQTPYAFIALNFYQKLCVCICVLGIGVGGASWTGGYYYPFLADDEI